MTSNITATVLHGVRLLGFAPSTAVAARLRLDAGETHEELLDQQAYGRVTWSEFGSAGGWSLTERGRAENERLLALELDAVPGGRGTLTRIHDDFLPVNARLQQACTDWQLRPSATDPLAPNDHRDEAWDQRVLAELNAVANSLAAIEDSLTSVLPRFAGYHDHFSAALLAGRIDDRVDSCHRVWFELHEDLIATLGISRTS